MPSVAEVRSAVAWYTEVLGFVEHVRIGDGHRSQLGLPDGPPAEVVIAEVGTGTSNAGARTLPPVMLKVADVAKVVGAAMARGGELIDEIHDWEYGERQAAINDPFDHQWVLTNADRRRTRAVGWELCDSTVRRPVEGRVYPSPDGSIAPRLLWR